MSWQILSIISIFFWGIWGFFSKLASNHINQISIQIIGGIGSFACMLFLFLFMNQKFEFNWSGASSALIGGLIGSAGGLAFYFALSKGPASIVVPLTALYPVITIILAYFFLGETLNLKQTIGIVLSIISVYLVS